MLNLCVKLLYVKFVCVKVLYVKFMCVKFVCVKLWYVTCVEVKLLYVKFVCVKLWYVTGGRRREEEEPGIQNQKQEPHTKLWGIKNVPNHQPAKSSGPFVFPEVALVPHCPASPRSICKWRNSPFCPRFGMRSFCPPKLGFLYFFTLHIL